VTLIDHLLLWLAVAVLAGLLWAAAFGGADLSDGIDDWRSDEGER